MHPNKKFYIFRKQETGNFRSNFKICPLFSSPPLHSLSQSDFLPHSHYFPSFLCHFLSFTSLHPSLLPAFRRKIPIENFPSSQYRNLLLPRLNFMFNNRYQGIEKGYIFLLETRLDSCYYQSVLPITNRLLILLVRNQSTVSIGFAFQKAMK